MIFISASVPTPRNKNNLNVLNHFKPLEWFDRFIYHVAQLLELYQRRFQGVNRAMTPTGHLGRAMPPKGDVGPLEKPTCVGFFKCPKCSSGPFLSNRECPVDLKGRSRSERVLSRPEKPDLGLREPSLDHRGPSLGPRGPCLCLRSPSLGLREPSIGLRGPFLGLRAVAVEAGGGAGGASCPHRKACGGKHVFLPPPPPP